MARKVVVSWSGGKDSAWTVHLLRRQGWDVVALLTTLHESTERVPVHEVRRELIEAQAAALGIPVWLIRRPWPCSNEVYDRQFMLGVRHAVEQGITHIAFGDLFLEDVRVYREERLFGTGLEPLFPLWGQNTRDLSRSLIESGIKARLSCVDSRVLDETFAGRDYDAALLADLPVGADPCGESGEFHTFSYDGPMFSRPLGLVVGDRRTMGEFIYADMTLERPLHHAAPDVLTAKILANESSGFSVKTSAERSEAKQTLRS
jgi:uncharacterized protein (TIGR00290 family)